MKYIKLIFIFLLLIIVVLEIKFFSRNTNNNLTNLASNIIKKCSVAKYKPACYDREIPKIVQAPYSLSLQNAFKVLKEVQEKDRSYAYCHLAAHYLAGNAVRKNPANWQNVFTSCPSSYCAYGCQHGVLLTHFNNQEIINQQNILNFKAEFSQICKNKPNWQPTPYELEQCYHGLGHVFTYLTNADIDLALKLCKLVVNPYLEADVKTGCTSGVFMQVFQQLEPEDMDLVKSIKPDKNQVVNFCSSFSQENRDACLLESWPLYGEQYKTPEGVNNFCANLKDPSGRYTCYRQSFDDVGKRNQLDANEIYKYCLKINPEQQGLCFGWGANSIIATNKALSLRAVELCHLAERVGKKVSNKCFDILVQRADFFYVYKSLAYLNYCKILPEPWRNNCLTKAPEYSKK